ncbi:MAG: transcriptional regulator NikR, CopG family [Variovorax sp.]|nr:transcriptional regulator NikR, CopG family [Variovorax sp.]
MKFIFLSRNLTIGAAMKRFTISLDTQLAQTFDRLVVERGYLNRSEAVRDLIRGHLGRELFNAGNAKWCLANVSYVYDRHDSTVVGRVLQLQHEHHDLVLSSHHTPLDHHHCVETVTLRGRTDAVEACANGFIALRGVRHGSVSVVPLHQPSAPHAHGDYASALHCHLEPVN